MIALWAGNCRTKVVFSHAPNAFLHARFEYVRVHRRRRLEAGLFRITGRCRHLETVVPRRNRDASFKSPSTIGRAQGGRLFVLIATVVDNAGRSCRLRYLYWTSPSKKRLSTNRGTPFSPFWKAVLHWQWTSRTQISTSTPPYRSVARCK